MSRESGEDSLKFARTSGVDNLKKVREPAMSRESGDYSP